MEKMFALVELRNKYTKEVKCIYSITWCRDNKRKKVVWFFFIFLNYKKLVNETENDFQYIEMKNFGFTISVRPSEA